MKRIILRKCLFWSIACSVFALDNYSHAATGHDHLVPVMSADIDRPYEKLVRSKLFVTRGEIARMVRIPGTVGVETVISVHQCNRQRDPVQFCVTMIEPSEMLWPFARDNRVPIRVTLKKCEAPLPAAAARAIAKTWSLMIADARPEANSERIWFEGMYQQFYVIDPTGRERRARVPKLLGKKPSALVELGNFLDTYCSVPPSMRSDLAKQIEKKAAAILKM